MKHQDDEPLGNAFDITWLTVVCIKLKEIKAGKKPRVRAQLHLEYADGSSDDVTFATTTPGAINFTPVLNRDIFINSLTIKSGTPAVTINNGTSGVMTLVLLGSAGLVYGINDDWTVDVGGTIGLSGRAEDFTLFLGTTFRF